MNSAQSTGRARCWHSCCGALVVLFLIFQSIPSLVQAAEVRNETVRQDGNRLVFDYDLDSSGPADVTVNVTYGGKEYPGKDLHLEGDVGKVSSGKGKLIFWNVLRDLPGGLSGEFGYEIVAVYGASFKDPFTGMEFVFVKGGCFQMGSIFPDKSKVPATPVHEVCLDDFYIGKYEATQVQWKAVMGINPSWKSNRKGPNYPVENVSWDDVQKFISKLNTRSGKRYRLPTEAEWEYAARSGGKDEEWSGTNDESSIGEYAWYKLNSGDMTHPVGQKRPNGFGIHDLTGNVWEWVQDCVGIKYYEESPRNNPAGPPTGEYRGIRGGYSDDDSIRSRVTFRNGQPPGISTRSVGFRLVTSTQGSLEGLTSPEKIKKNAQATEQSKQVTGLFYEKDGSQFTVLVLGEQGDSTYLYLMAGDKVNLKEFKRGDYVSVNYKGVTASSIKRVKKGKTK